MPEDIEAEIAEMLVKRGYENVEHGFGAVWYTDADGRPWTIEARMGE